MVRTIVEHTRTQAHRPLNAILAAPSHIAILRVLREAGEEGLTGRQIGRTAGVSHQATLDTLERLEEERIVHRRPAGRALLFRLNREHEIVSRGLIPLFDAEASLRHHMEDELRAALQRRVVSAALIGEKANELDILLLVDDPIAKEPTQICFHALSGRLEMAYGVRCSPLTLTVAEFQRMYREGKGGEIVKKAQTFIGIDVGRLARGI